MALGTAQNPFSTGSVFCKQRLPGGDPGNAWKPFCLRSRSLQQVLNIKSPESCPPLSMTRLRLFLLLRSTLCVAPHLAGRSALSPSSRAGCGDGLRRPRVRQAGLGFLPPACHSSGNCLSPSRISVGRVLSLSLFSHLTARRCHLSFWTERRTCTHHTLKSVRVLPLGPREADVLQNYLCRWMLLFLLTRCGDFYPTCSPAQCMC